MRRTHGSPAPLLLAGAVTGPGRRARPGGRSTATGRSGTGRAAPGRTPPQGPPRCGRPTARCRASASPSARTPPTAGEAPRGRRFRRDLPRTPPPRTAASGSRSSSTSARRRTRPAARRPPKARTECAQVAEDATAAEALAAVAKPLRYDSNALLCAIAGYPESGCADQVNGAKEPRVRRFGVCGAAADGGRRPGGEGDGGPSAGLLGGVAAVVVLGAAAVWQARRRRG